MVAEPEKTTTSETKTTQELPGNCLGCGKPIKKLKRYYRDGKFYCNKKCWRNYIAKLKQENK